MAEPVKSAFSFPNIIRMFGWCVLASMFVFLANNFLTLGSGMGGIPLIQALSDIGTYPLNALQAASYPAAIFVAIYYVLMTADMPLRTDADRITAMNTFLIRAAFWSVLIVGLADLVISAMRVEDMLTPLVGDQIASDLGRSHFRGMYVHVPLILFGTVLAIFTRTLGFHWLTLMIVGAELLIVFMRFIFSYEQAYMADLVRFWYGALFLFASAYTLLEEGHVRVDVFYTNFTLKTKSAVNAVCTILMGLTLCWTILIVGMGQKTSIINSPVFNFEVTQSGFGMYVKYMMAAFLGIFAVSMMIQFVSYLFSAVADYRGDPGARVIQNVGGH